MKLFDLLRPASLILSLHLASVPFAQARESIQADSKATLLASRLEIQGLKLLIETKMLDDKMPKLTGLSQEIWWAGSSADLKGASSVVVGTILTVGALREESLYMKGNAEFEGAPSSSSLILSAGALTAFTSASDYFKEAKEESNRAKEGAYAKIQHDVGRATDQISSVMAAIFSLSPEEQFSLKQGLIEEANRQLEDKRIRVDALEVMYNSNLISADLYLAAKEIRVILGNTTKRKKTIWTGRSLVHSEQQIQNMVDYLKNVSQKIEDREVKAHVAELLTETETELAFIKGQTDQ